MYIKKLILKAQNMMKCYRFFEILSILRKQTFALNKIDRKLQAYINFKRGFFIEAGANDGITYSNTLYFEKYYKWNGILVEPIPQLAKQCRINRPKCIVEQYALVSLDFIESHIEMKYCNHMSLVKGAMSEEEENIHIAKGAKIQDVEPFTLKVPAINLSSIIEKHTDRNIDFLSLDVEGYELNALKGIDFDKHKPSLMLIEARYRSEIDGYLKSVYEPVAEFSKYDVLYKALNI
jgi:FkbM family methyltransferase